MYLNKVTIIGNLTRNPELQSLPSGVQVCNFSVATNRTWKDATGQKQEAVEYHNVVSFGKQAETIAKYLSKGNQVLVEGRLQTRTWEKDGEKKYATEIMLESFQFGNNKPKDTEPVSKEEQRQKFEEMTENVNTDAPAIDYPDDEVLDIPF